MGNWTIRGLNTRLVSISFEFWKGNNFPFLVASSLLTQDSVTPLSRAKDEEWEVTSWYLILFQHLVLPYWEEAEGRMTVYKQQLLHGNKFKWKARIWGARSGSGCVLREKGKSSDEWEVCLDVQIRKSEPVWVVMSLRIKLLMFLCAFRRMM